MPFPEHPSADGLVGFEEFPVQRANRSLFGLGSIAIRRDGLREDSQAVALGHQTLANSSQSRGPAPLKTKIDFLYPRFNPSRNALRHHSIAACA